MLPLREYSRGENVLTPIPNTGYVGIDRNLMVISYAPSHIECRDLAIIAGESAPLIVRSSDLVTRDREVRYFMRYVSN